MYRDNFWEFSRKVCKGNLDKKEPKPTFSKETADQYYPGTYSTCVNFNVSDLNWFPRLHTPDPPIQFNMSHIKPKDIKHILKDKKSASAPGIDGLTYGVLKHLPSSHHFLATLFNKLLFESPKPSPLWQKSKISLIYKRNEPDNPKNFRPIALSSITGKIYHQILSNRILEYLIGNNYIDNSMQKAFINNINGTIEHNQLLQEIISHARVNKRTCHITFFDLKDAFGSISHSLIDHCLERYHIPENVRTYIKELYSNISGVVAGSGWHSEEFTFQRGVFQGDPLSPTIFITVFNPLLEYLKSESESKHGYKLNNSMNIVSTPFADDFNVITSHSRVHQRILRNVENFAKSMNLVLEPTKCKSLSICSGSSKVIEFSLNSGIIQSIANSPEKFLGSQITFSGKQSEIFSFIKESIAETLENIEKSLIREEYKISIYTRYVIPALRFKLTVHDITNTNLKVLDNMVDKQLKSWLHIPPSGTRAILHCKEGLDIKSISHLYRECHGIAHTSSRLKADSTVNVALDQRLNHEQNWTRKGSITVESENVYQSAVSIACQETGNVNITKVKSKVKNIIQEDISKTWHNHIKSLVLQGQFLRLLELEKSCITWKSIAYNLPRGILKFAVNSSIDTLPTKSNLKRWGKRSSTKCNFCDSKETLHHVLNNCVHMLPRYLWRHNSILTHIIKTISKDLSEQWKIYSDLPDAMQGCSTIPTDILVTAQKPDLVIRDSESKSIFIIELSVPFERNIEDTHKKKIDRYENLISDIKDSGYSVRYYALEVGSRGYISQENTKRLKDLLHKLKCNTKLSVPKQALSKISLISSFIIYHSKTEAGWCEPSFISV